ncbi:hypothetical protein JTB14_026871 [Gonioctena quinquepunctata]|nr:hypothetical protein JTB14_026871 [Gonioctena quinquepunctata]
MILKNSRARVNHNRLLEFRATVQESNQIGQEFRVRSATLWLKADFQPHKHGSTKCRSTDIFVFKIISKTLPERVTLTSRFNEEEDSLESHFSIIDKLVRELKSAGATMSETDIVCYLLSTLPRVDFSMRKLKDMEKVHVIIQKVLLLFSGGKKLFTFRYNFCGKIGYKKSKCIKLEEKKNWKYHRRAHIVEKDDDEEAFIGCIDKQPNKNFNVLKGV